MQVEYIGIYNIYGITVLQYYLFTIRIGSIIFMISMHVEYIRVIDISLSIA